MKSIQQVNIPSEFAHNGVNEKAFAVFHLARLMFLGSACALVIICVASKESLLHIWLDDESVLTILSLSCVAMFGGLYMFLLKYARTYVFSIESDKATIQHGVFFKKHHIFSLSSIYHVNKVTGFYPKLFNCATLVFYTNGIGGEHLKLPFIKKELIDVETHRVTQKQVETHASL